MRYPDFFEQWLNHDVKDCDMWQFKDVPDEDLYLYWDAIERKYLCRYRDFLRLEFEFSTCGLQHINYPGAMCISCYMQCDEILDLPKDLERELEAWCWAEELNVFAKDRNLYWRELDLWASAISLRVARYIPDDTYFEYKMLKQIVCRDGRGIELDYDPEIAEILHLLRAFGKME